MKITYHGHSCFLIQDQGTSLIFDPFITGNPAAKVKPEDILANYVLVSHGHGDHLGDTASIAKRNNALVVSTHEIAELVGAEGAKVHGMHLGGKFRLDFGYVRVTPAFHGAGVPGGHACGFIVDFHGRKVYFAGDTGLFGDMKLLGEIEPLDLALLPIGGNYTMDIDDAVRAVSFLRPEMVVPMHYNTFPVIEADPDEFKEKIERQVPGVAVRIVAPGESFGLPHTSKLI